MIWGRRQELLERQAVANDRVIGGDDADVVILKQLLVVGASPSVGPKSPIARSTAPDSSAALRKLAAVGTCTVWTLTDGASCDTNSSSFGKNII